jgi:UDP-glucose 4-epimerase
LKAQKCNNYIHILKLFKEIIFMAVLVTGGAGYIGSHTAIELLESGKDIVIIDNFYSVCYTNIDRIKRG